MTWSLRARLTAWYTALVVAVLVTGAGAVFAVQARLGHERLDDELSRLMLTLEGVMRTEINEGLDLQASADEASAEVVAPDRVLLLERPDGRALAAWGIPLPSPWPLVNVASGHHTAAFGSTRVRLLRRDVEYKGHRYLAAVGATLAGLETQQRELVIALAIGVVVALTVAAAGGWWVGRRTLRPLQDMADQAAAIQGPGATEHLRAPHAEDELGRLATAFNGLLDRLGAALQAQRQFMADASHELRTPVSIVRTTAQVALARHERTPDEYREALSIVAEQTARLTRLVDAMFLLARAGAQGIPVAREPVYVDEIVAECVRGLRVLAQDRGVTIHTTGATEVTLSGDPVLLGQMIGNVIDNAIRYTQPGGSVFIDIQHQSSAAIIAVRDTGPGILPDDHVRIFERFVRLDRQSEGAGLGLPIARWVAEAHDGRLDLATSSSAGSTFVITLPIDENPPL
jgi:signal transduction histidine kinase